MLLPLLVLLLLSFTVDGGGAQRVDGLVSGDSCVCQVNSSMWSFPVARYEEVAQRVRSCEASLDDLRQQITLSQERLPELEAALQNVTARLQPHLYLQHRGLYSDLTLRLLGRELSQLEADVAALHGQMNDARSLELSKEVAKLRRNVERRTVSDTINMKTVRETLRHLKNTAESSKTIPPDFRGEGRHCLKGLMSNISEPVVTKTAPQGKNLISGSWGKQAQMENPAGAEPDTYWVQPLVNSHIWGNTVRLYGSFEDFMAAARHQDVTLAPSHSHANAVEGPGGVLYGDALYYHCFRSADVCRYDLKTKEVKRATLPGADVGFNNKFPYCYYECRANSDVDLEADESGVWALYATGGSHGNLVASRLAWSAENGTLNVTHTWETRLFKKAASNAFVACGVLYATRPGPDAGREEVFYAFDTATGREDNTLRLPLEKVAKGVASLSYNPTDRRLYMYNDGYLLAYQASFGSGSGEF